MGKLSTFLFLFFITPFLFAQSSINWFRNFGSSQNTDASIIKSRLDENGNIYTIGKFTFYSNFMDNTTTDAVFVNGQNSYVAKYNSSGQLLWINNFGGSATDFVFDNNGDLIITGGFSGTITFNDNTTFTSAVSNQPQIYNLKLNKNSGAYIWKNTLSNSNSEYRPATGMAVTVLTDNNFIIATQYYGTIPGVPVYQLMKFDANGNIILRKIMDSVNNTGVEFKGLKSDNANNIYLIGSFYSILNLNVNGGQYVIEDPSGSGSLTAFISKFNSNFDVQWGKAIGGSSADQAITLEVDKVTQKSYVSFAVNGNNINLNNGGTTPVMTNFWQSPSSGVFVTYDGNGELSNYHLYTGSGLNVGTGYVDDIQLNGSMLVLSGRVYDKPDVDISSASSFPPSNAINERIRFFVSTFNINSNSYSLLKNTYFAVDMNNQYSDPNVTGLIVPNTSKIIIAGDNNSLIPYQGSELVSFPKHSAFLFQLDTQPQTLSTKETKNDFSLYVLTDSHNKTAKIISKDAVENVITFDSVGRKIFETQSTEFDISNLKEGLYFFQIKTTQGTVTKKFLKK
ncbi:T9SS type A sorting domain-containing protein [uncultured Chryseobacterium sp.]|jgi:hypothetical protein|uniref:T9SS type A sorting domain-containing protein n=1 Tax=uncultured Chryseobacterium sp. TaxID=259322 RepID=UPI00258F2917|nr:T9SS type A sorting domain-containing protein [uncultured Chryseobacterium sp.]